MANLYLGQYTPPSVGTWTAEKYTNVSQIYLFSSSYVTPHSLVGLWVCVGVRNSDDRYNDLPEHNGPREPFIYLLLSISSFFSSSPIFYPF